MPVYVCKHAHQAKLYMSGDILSSASLAEKDQSRIDLSLAPYLASSSTDTIRSTLKWESR